MPRQARNDERERRYEHVEDSRKERRSSEAEAGEIAARVVDKERAQAGETERASRPAPVRPVTGRRAPSTDRNALPIATEDRARLTPAGPGR